jgi:type I restriction enzyme S subunit
MNTFSSYTSYKPSGFDWLGDMPSHWTLRRLKFISSVTYSNVDKHTKEGEIPVRLCNYVDVYKNDHITNDLEFMEATADSGEIKKFGLQKGDVIVTKDSEEWKDIAVPAFVPENLEGIICGYHLALIRPYPNQIDGEYLFRAFRTPAINYQFQVAASGITRYGLGKQDLGDAWIMLPPIEEQRAISAYLAQETSHIDSLIAKKRELIDLLDKKRASIISHAVTKGLNPKARMKSSGMEWLGDVPEHWEVKKLKYVVSMKSGDGITAENISPEGEYPVYGGNGLRGYTDRFTHEGHFILIGRQGALCGNINYGNGKFFASEHAVVANPIKPLATLWLGELLRIMNLNQHSISAAQPGLAVDRIKQLLIPHPPKDEQFDIAEFVNKTTKHTEELIKKIEESIDLLQKQRTALISAAVTGKIDVREQGN